MHQVPLLYFGEIKRCREYVTYWLLVQFMLDFHTLSNLVSLCCDHFDCGSEQLV